MACSMTKLECLEELLVCRVSFQKTKKLDADYMVCVLYFPFFSSFLIVGLGNYLVHFCVYLLLYASLKDLKLAPFSNYLYWYNWLVDFFTETNS